MTKNSGKQNLSRKGIFLVSLINIITFVLVCFSQIVNSSLNYWNRNKNVLFASVLATFKKLDHLNVRFCVLHALVKKKPIPFYD